MKKIKLIIGLLVTASLISVMFFTSIPSIGAQSDQSWSDPINLSNSGAATDPFLVIDKNDVIHVIWVDIFDGYKYTKSEDGISWVDVKTVNFPFSIEQESQPILLATEDGNIHIFWQDRDNALFYSRATSLSINQPSSWIGRIKLADSVITFEVEANPAGGVHVSYITNSSEDADAAGIYYRKLSGFNWLGAVTIYTSPYFRAYEKENASISLAVDQAQIDEKVYISWDDRSQKRIFLIGSSDGGRNWGEIFEISGPNDIVGTNIPFNSNVDVIGGDVLLTWQVGVPGGRCEQYSQVFVEDSNQAELPLKVADDLFPCRRGIEFIAYTEEFSVARINFDEDVSLVAWDGTKWGDINYQNEASVFFNPVTFDSVVLGCQSISVEEETLYMVGCDQGNSGDVWFLARPLGYLKSWVPTTFDWSAPITLTLVEQVCQEDNTGYLSCVNSKISTLLSKADHKKSIHTFWIQSFLEGADNQKTLQYAKWNGEKWSDPTTVSTASWGSVAQYAIDIDMFGNLFIVWVDEIEGEMLFSFADVTGANSLPEWREPVYVPAISKISTSPDILIDSFGKIVVAFAYPFNKDRGIYIVVSDDNGETWSYPQRVFDAETAGWDMIDEPQLSLTGDGRLHILFKRYSVRGGQKQPTGLYYSRSIDGGITWSNPDTLSEQNVSWSSIVNYGEFDVHRLWSEERQSSIIFQHQVSQDGGMTWNVPTRISTANNYLGPIDAAMDQLGQIHFFQLSDIGGRMSMNHNLWNGNRWIDQESYSIDPFSQGGPSVISVSVDAQGNLLLATLTEISNLNGDMTSEIISLSRSLMISGEIPTPYPASIPVVEYPTQTSEDSLKVATAQPGILPTPSPGSPVSGLGDMSSPSTLPKYKNLTGYFILGGVLLTLILVFRNQMRR